LPHPDGIDVSQIFRSSAAIFTGHYYIKSAMENSLKQFIATHCPIPVWLRRLGLAGLLFFFIKGMMWIGVSAVIVLGIF
jgi:hypothetical protein